MTITEQHDVEQLKAIGQIVAETIQLMGRHVRPGITTKALDEIGREHLEKRGAQSAPELMYRFPGATCISVNEEAAHGIPGDRVIQEGDLVNIDVSAEKNGYFADSGFTFTVGEMSQLQKRLVHSTQLALQDAMKVAKAGNKLNEIGRVIEKRAKKSGFKTLRDLASHGIGRSLHEYPECIPNYFDKNDKRRLEEGMVITIEPFLSTHSQSTETADDGWTLISGQGNLSAQFEHTMIITKKKPILTTVC